MGLTDYPGGLTSFGSPVSGSRFSSPWATHYFVDGDDGDDISDGLDPLSAKATIQAAVTAASAQDVIYVRPKAYQWGQGFRRYVEDVVVPVGDTTGSGNVSDNAGMSLIGVTPRTASAADINGVRVKATTTAFTVNTQAFHFENIDIFAEGATYAIDAPSTAWTVGADGMSIYNCSIKGAPIRVQGSADQSIVGCRFVASFDGVVAQILMDNNGNHTRLLIKNCEWVGGTSTAAADGAFIKKEAGCIQYATIIRDCYFPETPTGDVYIDLSADNTGHGMIANCYLATAAGEGGEIVPDGLQIAGCYDSSGLLPSV